MIFKRLGVLVLILAVSSVAIARSSFDGVCPTVTLGIAGIASCATDREPTVLLIEVRDTSGEEPGFVSLFNGEDLSGWRYGSTELTGITSTEDGRFMVKDGVLVITGSPEAPPKMTEIDTVDSYDSDFTLRFEFRASERANSGLHLRDKVFAHQLQIRDYPRVGPYKDLEDYKTDDWNAIEVVVTGTNARCTCNGELLEEALAIPQAGPISLQSETNIIEYRNIRIKKHAQGVN